MDVKSDPVSVEFIKRMTTIPDAEFKYDIKTLGLYATDASVYQVLPDGVFIPGSIQSVSEAIILCNQFKIPVSSRGSATSLAGQATNRGIIFDFSTYFNRILSIDPAGRTAVVQPGVTRDQLNREAAIYNLHFAPDPATTSRATIGGMIANNSSGTKSIKYGKTINHIRGLKIVHADGNVAIWNEDLVNYPKEASIGQDSAVEKYSQIMSLVDAHKEGITKAFPKVMRRVMGYPLDEFVLNNNCNPAWIFAGSEGTLGLIVEATVQLEPIPKYKAAFTVHFDDRMKAISSVKHMLKYEPAAVEMLDYHVFQQSKHNPLTAEIHQKLIIGEPKATMSVEFFCLSEEELQGKISEFSAFLKNLSGAYAYPLLKTAEELEWSWSLRKNGLGLIMGDPSGRKPMPFIEDMAVPVEYLDDYIKEVLHLCETSGVETVLYAHASVGVLHVRPALDLRKQEDIFLMKFISSEVLKLVKKYNGAWSGEHGDGRNRSPYLKEFFGEEVYGLLKRVKNIFDPNGILNPNIIVDAEPMDMHLRYGSDYKESIPDMEYKYRHDHSFSGIVHNCSGVGACRNHFGGTMCPSFRATHLEEDSTRGRANALRLAISGQLGFNGLTDPKVLETLDLCLSCKACKSECPSNVDMAKLKSEVLQKKFDSGNITLRERLIKYSRKMAQTFSGKPVTPVINRLQSGWLGRQLLSIVGGIHQKRVLPSFARVTLGQWYRENYKTEQAKPQVALFADTYIQYHEPHIGIAAIEILSKCGYDVLLVEAGCCQRPKISNGFLKDARHEGSKTASSIYNYIKMGIPVLVCEPSCTSALTDDLPDLLDDEKLASALEGGVFQIEEFLALEIKTNKLKGRFVAREREVLIHGHCHMKSSKGMHALETILATSPENKYTIAQSGCCGMAGSFGYEKEHFETSKKIFDQSLGAYINQSKSVSIWAPGFSCRHQIRDFGNKKPLHWVESVYYSE